MFLKKIVSLLLFVSLSVGYVSAEENHNLTDTQLHAFLGIITNFILSDVDSDGDGVLDSQDAFPHDATESVDTDGDGIGNNADSDDDNDGLSDADEATYSTNPLLIDTDGDGSSDGDEIAQGSDPLDVSSTLDDTYFKITVKIEDNGAKDYSKSFVIPVDSVNSYNYTVDCNNDGIDEAIGMTENYTCEYGSNGVYTIVIKDNSGTRDGFPHIYFYDGIDNNKLVGINQWGTMRWSSMKQSFSECTNLNDTGGVAIDVPDLSSVTDMSWMFEGAETFNQDIGEWDISSVSDMRGMFEGAEAFNQDIGEWNTSSVTDMRDMFYIATTFNQDIGDWNTSAVTNMSNMFMGATDFNQALGTWDTSKVIDMSWMFAYATSFNQSIGAWNTSAVINMNVMFAYATSFNQALREWDTSAVTMMYGMFASATAFNQALGDWNTSIVTDMSYMFYEADAFTNHDLSTWHIGAVTNHENFMIYAGAGNIEPDWYANSADFVMTVKIDNDNDTFRIRIDGSSSYNYNVDCDNDGTDEATAVTEDYTCNYEDKGFYTIVIKDNTGTQNGFPHIYFNGVGDKDKLVGINHWGTMKWNSMRRAFYGCSNLASVGGAAKDVPDLSNVTDMSSMFSSASIFNQDIRAWDTSTVEDMSIMFASTTAFNQDISSWDVNNVVNMYAMFAGTTAFNQDLSSWDFKVRSVTNMNSMFEDAIAFSQDLSGWDVSADPTHDDFATGSGGVVEPIWP